MSEHIYEDSDMEHERYHVIPFGSMREEIVRCRDCKYRELMTVSYLDKPLSVCISEQWIGAEGDNPLVKPDGFCAWGERNES